MRERVGLKSPVRENCTPGSVRGASGNRRPYRDGGRDLLLCYSSNKKESQVHQDMHIITRKRLNEFAEQHPETKSALERWYREMKRRTFASFAEVQSVFPAADHVGKLTVFNLGGNKVRLIAAIHYHRRRVYIRAVLTHQEYDENKWKE